ncbi:putative legumain protein [Helianthus annuus]|nr:putative legumain protein [Helianthus annuus]
MWRSRVLLHLTIIFMATIATMVTFLLPHAPSASELMLYESHLDEEENRIRWDAVRAMSNPIHPRDAHLLHLYQQYKNSSTSNRPTFAKEILDAVTKLAYLDSRIDMIGLLLFGPTKAWSTLRAVRDVKKPPPPAADAGLQSTLKLFEKHCGLLTEHGMKQSLANIYHYAVHKEAIHEAIILACGMHKIRSHGIDMANPKIDLTPSPLHGTFQYCGRVSVNALPTPKVERSYGKTYQVTVVPSKSIPHGRHSMIHICFHRNDSLGLCQCDKDDWMAIQKGSWSSFMPPHEKRIVDVKFAAGISHFVTVTLDEVSPSHGWRDGLPAGYIALSFIAVSKYMFAQDGVVHSVKRVMCVLALTCLFTASYMGYIGTYLPIVAVGSCLAIYYTITSIIGPILSKMTMLWPRILHRQGSTGSEEISMKECGRFTRNMMVELASSQGFEEWMIRNAESIKICARK